jgi:CheY-like chemotaxis protein
VSYVWDGQRRRVHLAAEDDATVTVCGSPAGVPAGDGDAARKGACDHCLAARSNRKTVVLVDDEPMILRLLHRVLDSHEHAVVVGEATNGAEALDLWQTLRPDVIVLDHMMPGVTGLEVAEEVLSQAPEQRIILFTATTDVDVADEARSLGITACVPKTDVWSIVGLLRDS